MPRDLLAALALVLVLEGLLFFVAPQAWKRMADQMQAIPPRHLRVFGAIMVLVGLGFLSLIRA